MILHDNKTGVSKTDVIKDSTVTHVVWMKLQAKEKNKINIYMCVSYIYIYKDWEIKTEHGQMISLFKSPMPRKKGVFFFWYWKKKGKRYMMHMDYWRRELATRLRNTAPFQLFHVMTLTLALDAASHLPSGLKEQCKIAATARAGKKKSPGNDGVHQRGSFWADCIPWTQAWSHRRWLPPSGRRKQRGGKSQMETKTTKKIMW